MDQWNSTFAEDRPPLLLLREAAAKISGEDWPDLVALQRLLDDAGVRVASGLPLRLVPAGGQVSYEHRVFESAELECREYNWHDLFNVLAWLAFPQSKAALNARHQAAWKTDAGAGRGAVRDALALRAPPSLGRARGSWVVRLTRAAPAELDDDNLSSAFKAVRDAVAAWLGVDDSPRSPVRWKYAQERVKHRAERLVRIDLRPCRRAKEAP